MEAIVQMIGMMWIVPTTEIEMTVMVKIAQKTVQMMPTRNPRAPLEAPERCKE